MPLTSPRLWVAATPIGNPGDLTPRARQVLSRADVILCEDTRRAGLLFKRLGLSTRARLVSFFEHNEEARLEAALGFIESGLDVVLISDAGAPLVSDPGYRLVRACRDKNLPVSPLPGPSAPLAAIMACGLPPYPMTFLGFAPRSKGERRKLFAGFAGVGTTLVLFERKSRLAETMGAASEVLGDREFCVARELTKEHEEFILGSLSDLSPVDRELKGEITLVVGPPRKDLVTPESEVVQMIQEESAVGASPKETARRVKERTSGWTVKKIYELAGRKSRARKEEESE